ncbi:MAG: aspartate-semialdehyde dehydrogenase [Hymenobacteraceae bacterium]|nr:aspartate-semialdehyde dehydrogenase [Hymenobacteraceae bacterium]
MKLAIVGATGLVGQEVLKVLTEHEFPLTELLPVASAASVGSTVLFRGAEVAVIGLEAALAARPAIAVFSAGAGPSREWAPRFAAAGCFVIDNSSAWRMEPEVPLVVPEVNADALRPESRIIANPNCSTIQLVLALSRLHARYRLHRLVVSTYQSVTGTGKAAVTQLMEERAGHIATAPAYPHPIDLNVLPHIDIFESNDYTKEEMKVVRETRKILADQSIGITCTAVRLPVLGGHSEAVNAEFHDEFDLTDVRRLLAETPGVEVVDDPATNRYPMPRDAHGRDVVLVGRVRRDESQPRTLNLWIVADNLRKGAATNAVQIATQLYKNGWL